MKRFLVFGLVILMVAVIGLAQTKNKVELEEVKVPSSLQIKVDLVQVYNGMETVGEETIYVINRETLYSNSTVITAVALCEVIRVHPDLLIPFTELTPFEIGFTITHYGDIGFRMECGDFDKNGVPDVLLTYKSGDQELIFFNPEYQSIDVIPWSEKEEL